MAPRRPTAPRAAPPPAKPTPPAAKPTPPGRPAARPAVPPLSRPSAGRPPGSGRPPATGRAPSRPLSSLITPPPGVTTVGAGRARTPVIRPLTMVAGVLVVLILLLAPYVRPWVAQRSQIADGARSVQELQREVNQLAAERRRWDDPAYVRAQARARLHFVMPGETAYVMLDDGAKQAVTSDPRSARAAVPGRITDEPWYATVWDSIRIAGDPSTEQARSVDPR